jgi:Na+-transporting NADH:ubiquinone oxidoreductase subunit C
MAVNDESIGRTLLVAAGVALFCSVLVSAAVTYLRPVQLAWAEIDRNRVILDLAGILQGAASAADRDVAARFRELDIVLIDLAAGEIATGADPLSYDPRDAGLLAIRGVAIPADLDLARLGSRAPLAPVYVAHRADGTVIILPLWGQGMWAPIQAYLALENDCSTVAGFAVYEHGETPGVGDRIERPAWEKSWIGLRPFDSEGRVMLAPRGSGRLSASLEEMHAFDAISGATVTVNAVMHMVRYWLGPHGFGPFLRRCRAGEVDL